jgi:hypothetical protein
MITYFPPITYRCWAPLPAFLLPILAGIIRAMPIHPHGPPAALYLLAWVPAVAVIAAGLFRVVCRSRTAPGGGQMPRRKRLALSKTARRAFILRAVFGLLIAFGPAVEIVLGVFLTPAHYAPPAHPRTWIPLYILLGKMERAPTFPA